MPSILPLAALAELSGKSAQNVKDILEEWSHRRLLIRVDGSYQFDHEKKQTVAQAALADVLHDGGKSAARQLHNFFLSHVGFSDETHPEATSYLDFALAVAGWGQLESEEVAFLENSIAVVRDFEGPLGHALPSAKAILKAPWNTRFLLFHIAVARLPETEDLVYALHDVVLADRQQGYAAPLNFAQGLFNVVFAYGNASRLVDVERVLGELGQLQQRLPDRPEIALELAKGMVNAAVAYGKASRLEDVERVLDELRQLQQKSPDQPEIAVELAKGLFNAAFAYGMASGLEDVERVLGELRRLQEKFPDQPEIAVAQAKGLFNAAIAYRKASRTEDFEQVLGELRQLQQKFPDQPEIALRVAKGLNSAAVDYGNASRTEDVERVLGELRQLELQGNFGDRPDIAACYARALVVARRLDMHTDSLQEEINRLFQAFGETEEFAPLGKMLKPGESGPENHGK